MLRTFFLIGSLAFAVSCDDEGGASCSEGERVDCEGDCMPSENWGDGQCDAFFNCSEMDYDMFDCDYDYADL